MLDRDACGPCRRRCRATAARCPASTDTRAVTDAGQHGLAVGGILLVEPLERRAPTRRGRCTPSAASVSRAATASCTSEPVAMRITSGVPFGASASTYAPLAARSAEANVSPDASPSPRSNTGMFWRVRAMPAGPAWRRSISSHDDGGLVRVAGAHDREVRDGAQRRELLDRLVGRAVLAERDGVVRPDEDARDVHQRGQADRGPHVVAEDQERAAERAGGAVQHDAVDDRAHRVLADAEVQHAAVRVARPLVRGPLGRDEGLRVLDRGEVRLGEVGGAAPQLGELGGERVDHRAGRGAGRDVLARLEHGQRGRRCRRAARAPARGRSSALRSGLAAAQASNALLPLGVRGRAALAEARACARGRRRRRRRSRRGRSRAPSSSRRARRRRARSRGSCRCSACRARASR